MQRVQPQLNFEYSQSTVIQTWEPAGHPDGAVIVAVQSKLSVTDTPQDGPEKLWTEHDS